MSEKSNSCTHCGRALVKNNNSKICRSCRFNGHKEFGACAKCLPKQAQTASGISIRKTI